MCQLPLGDLIGTNFVLTLKAAAPACAGVSDILSLPCPSKQLAALLSVSEGAIRKQRSKDRSLFPYAKLGGRIFYPAAFL